MTCFFTPVSTGLSNAGAQLTLEECYRQARANYPLIRQYGLIEKTREYNLENAARGYLPQLAFSAQATYQSDVTRIPIDLDALGFTGVEIPTLSQDQYKAELSLSQTIWDGGAIRSVRGAAPSARRPRWSNATWTSASTPCATG